MGAVNPLGSLNPNEFVQPQPEGPVGGAGGLEERGEGVRNEAVRDPGAPAQGWDVYANVRFERLPLNVQLARKFSGLNAESRYRKLLEDSAPLSEKHYDRNSYQGQYEMICDAAAGFCRKFVEGDLDALRQRALKAGASPATVDAQLGQIRKTRLSLVGHITNELAAAHDRLLGISPGTVDYTNAITTSLGNIKSTLRNFRYRFDRDHALMTGYSHFKRAIGQFFSNSTRTHDNEAAAQFRNLAELESHFKELCGDRVVLGAGRGAGEFTESRLLELSEDCHTINEAIRNIDKSVDARGYAFEMAKSLVGDLATHGGEKFVDISGGVGAGFKIGTFDGRVMAKGHHYYKIHSKGNGEVTVEHLNQLGIAGRATAGWDNLAKVDLNAEFGGGIKTGSWSVTFKDIDSAARYLSGNVGKLNPLTLYGNIGKLVGDTVLGAAKILFKPFCWLGRNALWLAGVNTALDSGYGKNGEQDFVNRMTVGNILGKVAERILPGANLLKSGRREYRFAKGGGEASGTFQTVFANLAGGLSENVEFQHKAVNTDYKPYMAVLEDEMHGTVLARVEREFDAGEGGQAAETRRLMFTVNVGRILGLVADPGLRTPDAILKALADINKSMNDFARTFDADPGAKVPASAIARYRATARVAAALFEMWEALPEGGVSKAQTVEFGRLSALVRRGVTNPSVKFPSELLQRELMVGRSYKDNVIVNRATVLFTYDALGSHSFKVMEGNELLEGGKLVNRMARAGVEGGLAGANGMTGVLQNGIEAEFITHVPKSTHRRPWQNDRRTEINLRFGPDSLVLDPILWAIGKAVADSTNAKNPANIEEAGAIAAKTLGLAGMAALKRLFKDFRASASFGDVGDKLVKSQEKSLDVNAESMFGRLDIRSGRNVQLVIEGGRLTGISFGDHSKVDIRIDLGEVVVAEGEFNMDSVTNRNTFALDPSFHSLLAKCDGMTGYGNQANWVQYAAKQRGAFARMFDVVRNAIADGRNADVPRDKKEVEDGKQFRAIFAKMGADLARMNRMTGSCGAAFQKNWENFNNLVAEISDGGGLDEIVKARKMQNLLECITRHFNLVDMDLSADETVDPNLRMFRQFAAENGNGWFRIAKFSPALQPDGTSGVTLATGDRVWRLVRDPAAVAVNNEARRRLLRAIIADLHPEQREELEAVQDFAELLERLPAEIRNQIKPEDFDGSGKPLTAYRIGRILDVLAAYRVGQLIADDAPVENAGAGRERIIYP